MKPGIKRHCDCGSCRKCKVRESVNRYNNRNKELLARKAYFRKNPISDEDLISRMDAYLEKISLKDSLKETVLVRSTSPIYNISG